MSFDLDGYASFKSKDEYELHDQDQAKKFVLYQFYEQQRADAQRAMADAFLKFV